MVLYSPPPSLTHSCSLSQIILEATPNRSHLCRRIVLPLVCREWAAACREPCTLWSHISLHDEGLQRAAHIRFCLLRVWLLQRMRSIASLEIRFDNEVLCRYLCDFGVDHVLVSHLILKHIGGGPRFGRHQHDLQGGSLASLSPSMVAAGTLEKLTLQLPTLKLQPRDFAALGHITVRCLHQSFACILCGGWCPDWPLLLAMKILF